MIRFYLLLLSIIVVSVVAVNKFLDKPVFPQKEVIADSRYISIKEAADISDTNTLSYHFYNVNAHFQKPFYQQSHTGLLYREDEKIKDYYRWYARDADPVFSDIGNFGLAACFYYLKMPEVAIENLMLVKHKSQNGYHLLKGMIFAIAGMLPEAEAALNTEIATGGLIKEAESELVKIWWKRQNLQKLEEFIYNPEKRDLFPDDLARLVYYKLFDVVNYLKITILYIQPDLIALFTSLFIALIWLYYLALLDIFKQKRYSLYFLVFLISAGTSSLAYIFYDLYHYTFHFRLTGGVLNDFLYSVFGIGLIEETVKILPMLVFLWSRPQIFKEPFDYILFASISALGFAFAENLVYLDNLQTEGIKGRALMATVSHMFDSSLIAYGVILAKYRNQGSVAGNFIIGLFLAAFTHGFYDFWLLNKSVSVFYMITIVFMLVSLLVWITLINNSLNNSPFFNYRNKPDTKFLQKYLLSSTAMVILGQYLLTAVLKGAEISNSDLSISLISVMFFAVFYSTNFSYVDIVKGFWGPVSLQRFINKVWYNEVIGRRVILKSSKDSGKYVSCFPIKGLITGREIIEKETGIYSFVPDEPLQISETAVERLFLKSVNSKEINSEAESLYLVLIPAKSGLREGVEKSRKDVKSLGPALVILENNES